MAEEKQTKKKAEGWVVGLQIVDENQPPVKLLQKGEETVDLYGAIAKLLNDVDDLKGLL